MFCLSVLSNLKVSKWRHTSGKINEFLRLLANDYKITHTLDWTDKVKHSACNCSCFRAKRVTFWTRPCLFRFLSEGVIKFETFPVCRINVAFFSWELPACLVCTNWPASLLHLLLAKSLTRTKKGQTSWFLWALNRGVFFGAGPWVLYCFCCVTFVNSADPLIKSEVQPVPGADAGWGLCSGTRRWHHSAGCNILNQRPSGHWRRAAQHPAPPPGSRCPFTQSHSTVVFVSY